MLSTYLDDSIITFSEFNPCDDDTPRPSMFFTLVFLWS